MTAPRRSLLVRSASGLWAGLNFTRRLLLNLLMLALLLVLFIALFSPGPRLLGRTTLVLAPEGELVEQYRSDPGSRALARLLGERIEEVQLRDLLRAIDAAAADTRIERLLLRPDRLTGGGLAALREVAAALQRFRASGKQVIAYANGMDQRQYLLAAAADEVWLHPEGAVLLEGLSRYRLYYREALQDKLRVDIHLFRVGEYKSAAEPWILDGPSDEALAADLHWMNDLWNRYVDEVSTARKLEPAELHASIATLADGVDAADGQLSQLALDQGLVDRLMREDEARAELVRRGDADDDGNSFRQVDGDGYLDFLGPVGPLIAAQPTVAVVVAQGEITGGTQHPGAIGGDSTSALLRNAREDEHVRAVVLRVDSPGGEVFASEQIRREVELLKAAGKPVVVSMSNLAASGGYWISMNADRIFASPSTITGSIGIYGLFPTVPRTLEMVGMRVDGAATTPIAGAFDLRRPLQPEVARIVQRVIDRGYREFVGKVAEARGRSPEEIDRVARGRVWTGAQALEHGLVDALGDLRDAIADAAQRAGIEGDDIPVRYIEEEPSPFARLVADLTRTAAVEALLVDSGLAGRLLPRALLRQAGAELEFLTRPIQGPLPVRVISHCFCEM